MAFTRRRFVGSLGVAGASIVGGVGTAHGLQSTPADPKAKPADVLIKLDQNENPNPPSEAVRKAVMDALQLGNRYPRNAGDLLDALASEHGVLRENILLGVGSGELLKSAVIAFVSATRPLVAGLPTFETSTSTAKALGLPVREIPVDKNLRLDLPSMEAASGGSGLLFFCNPNNPTGTVWPTKDIEGMIDRVTKTSPQTIILIDEAYAHFAEGNDYWSLAKRAVKQPNLLVLRTFSKAYGIAGLRVGYAIGVRETLATLRKCTTSAQIPTTSVAAALAALGDTSLVRLQVQETKAQRAAVTRTFQAMGLTVFPSEANFVLVDVKRKPEAFQAACRERGVLVGRPFPGLESHSRISIGSSDEMRQAFEVFKAVLAQTA
ncbi:MAG: aminotransferase class I/II-fold pyridoxal phosphate-dependent enzyme [Vicinamibacteria bacterium]